MSDQVDHPKHYTQKVEGFEPIEVTKGLNFCLGNAFKYVYRHDYKGKPEEDLKKALWYLEKQLTEWNYSDLSASFEKLVGKLPSEEFMALWNIFLAASPRGSVMEAQRYIRQLLSKFESA